MTTTSTNKYSWRDEYHILRHLFTEVSRSIDGRWQLQSTLNQPGKVMITRYIHTASGNIIGCESFDYNDASGEYESHIFTFKQGEE